MTNEVKSVPSVSVSYARNGSSTKANTLGMRPMQERAYEKRGEQYLLIKSPPASGKSRALMFIALDKLANQGVKQAFVVVPEKSIGSSFNDEPLTKYGFSEDWHVEPRWNLCNAPGTDGGKVNSVGAFLESDDKILVCTHATFRFAVDRFGVEAFDGRLIAVDEFHHVSANPDNKLGQHLGAFMARDKVHVVAMTGSYFRGDADAVLAPNDEAKFDTVTYTYYEQLNGYEYLKQLDIGYFFYSGSYADDILEVLDPNQKTSRSIIRASSPGASPPWLVFPRTWMTTNCWPSLGSTTLRTTSPNYGMCAPSPKSGLRRKLPTGSVATTLTSSSHCSTGFGRNWRLEFACPGRSSRTLDS